MNAWNRSVAVVLVLTVMGLFIPNTAFCSDSRYYAKADSKQITRHEPKIKSTSEVDIPVDKKSGVGKWVLIGLGAAVVVALAAGVGGGGDDDDDDGGGQTGTFNAEW